jgi:uncharacterized membrane protein
VQTTRVARWALAAAACVWTVALFAAPGLLFPIGHFICHQRPDRSFFVHARQMPVCARCTGLYVGATLAVPISMIVSATIAASRARTLLVVAALPTAVTWSLEFLGLVPFSNVARCVVALPLGFVAAWLVLGELRGSPAAPGT